MPGKASPVWAYTNEAVRECKFSLAFLTLIFLGVKNSLVANDMAFETVQAPWSPEHEISRMKLVKKLLTTENKAAFRHRDEMPRYIYFAANNKNKWGHDRGYRIQLISFSGDPLPETDPMERAISWGR